MRPIDLETLRLQSLEGLEEIYRAAPLAPLPTGCTRGLMLGILENRGTRRPLNRAIDRLFFDLTPYGVDFATRCWWFVRPRLQVGRFRADAGRSRWRDTETYGLRYDVSRLPGRFSGLLYDEVKPLGPDLCLGIGGLNRETGEGDQFFFALRR